MYPARDRDEAAVEERVKLWRDQLPTNHSAFPGDPRGWEKQHCRPATLTDLGRKLLGADPWPSDGGGTARRDGLAGEDW